ncbi:MAG: hypothetical protein LBI11_00450, partial [Streptococcaceae bacterium]|nr:hypothetical protein [Streptococcaceae bacterium]
METKKKIGSKKFLRIVNILLIFAILIVGAGVTILANLEILIFASIWMFGIPLLIFFAFLGLLLGNFRLSNYKLKMLVF